MGNSLLSLIIAAIVILVHVGTVLAKYAEKKKKEEASRRAMEARRMQERGLGIELPGSGATPTMGIDPMHPQPVARPMGQTASRVDELAARRQAQLEQLRQRRDSRRAGSVAKPAGAAVRAQGHAPTTPPSQQTRGMRPEVRIEDRSHEDVARREAQLKRQRELQERQKAAEARAAEEREQRENARLIEQRRRQASRKATGRSLLSGELAEGVANAVNDPYGRATAASFAAGVQRQLKHNGSLREVLVLKEVLDPPLSMREP